MADTARPLSPSVRVFMAAVVPTNRAYAALSPASLFRRRFDARENEHLFREAGPADLDRRDSGIQLAEFGRCQSNFSRADVLEHVPHLRRTWDGHDPRL